MPSPEERYAALESRLAELTDLRAAIQLLGWDQQTMMPPGGAAPRGDVMATLERHAHDRARDDALLEVLEALEPWARDLPEDDLRADVIRVVRRDTERARRVPTDLAAEITLAAAQALPAWERARAESDFATFAPYLERNVELRRRLAACRPAVDHPYDALVDDFEPGMTTEALRTVLATLTDGLVPMIAEVAPLPQPAPPEGPFDVRDQRALALEIARSFGFTDDQWRLDGAVHPFAQALATTDIRVTSRYRQDDLSGLFAVMHEMGHGLYEHQVEPALARTTLGTGTSLGLHESQSRLWECLVGRGRSFWAHWLPRAQDIFPGLRDHGLDAFLRAINAVRPSLIRVDADEATYPLHIVLRFELEVALIDGDLAVADLPAAWTDRMRSLLGVEVPDDRRGVLQDVHWAFGELGYFPTYALGDIAAVQLWEAATRDEPGLDDAIAAGDVGPLRDWLRDHVHRPGRRLDAPDVLRRATGSGYDAGPLLAHLRAKLDAMYER